MRRIRLNRKQKIVRNLLVCAVLGLVVYTMLGFPPYTVQGMLERMERKYLLPDLEPILVERAERKYSTGWFHEIDYNTYLLAKTADDTYIYSMYRRNFLRVQADYGRNPKIGQGSLCTAQDGTLYVAGPFQNAAAATAEVTAQRTTQYSTSATGEREIVKGETRTFTFQGEKRGDDLFAFRYRAEDHKSNWFGVVPDAECDLENVAYQWYKGYVVDLEEQRGYSLLHADLPVHVTLYGEDGAVLDTLDLTVDTYELHFRY